MKKLNIGSGDIKMDGVESVDINVDFKPDHCFDLKVFPWPLESETYDEIYFFHCIEHIQKNYHPPILKEIRRLLKPDGLFIVSFPEFEIIVKNWLNNEQGMRGFWEANVYGRQASAGDFHVCAMDAEEMKDLLLVIGFKDIELKAEFNNHHNTVIRCLRGDPMKSYEQVVYEDVIR